MMDEHDLFRRRLTGNVLGMAGQGSAFGDVRVGDVMTRSPVTVSPDDDVFAAARLMGERRIRHLPVVQDGNVLGLVGIRDVMRTLVELVYREHDPEARETARALLQRGGAVPSPSAEGV